MKRIIIQGSSRSKGNTNKVVRLLMKELEFDVVDLSLKKIEYFDYEFKNQKDGFLSIIKQIAEEYELIVFATPVYWYSMSGIMKTFFDRLSDCLKIEKETGRKLRGKNMAVISCGSDETETEGFFTPFRNSAEYLGMTYLGNIHTWIEDELVSNKVETRIQNFVKLLLEAETNTVINNM
ncbi:MAG: NAD(P)H-dependent oxidoreductase [Bacteroidetes bacterium]|nr:NAD(P)H-dependent oxidoreductase [Bacteroidota bacterium]